MTDKLDKTFHYTKSKMVKDLIELIPFEDNDIALDAGSGKNKIWQKECPVECLECEIDDGCDFLKWEDQVDWIIGNPPYKIGWEFMEHSLNIAVKGIAFLASIKNFNQFTPRRLDIIKEYEFELQKIHIVVDKRWYGRYYFLVFEKKNKPGILSWERKVY